MNSMIRQIVKLPKRDMSTALAVVLGAIHLMFVCIYLTGRAKSVLPYKVEGAQHFVESPVIPIVHALALSFLVIAIRKSKVRQTSSLVTTSAFAGHCAALCVAANQHIPPASLVGFWATLGLTLIGLLLVAGWGIEDDDKEVK